MKNAIWGAGIYGARYLTLWGEADFDFFWTVITKKGIFCRKLVMHLKW